MTKQLEEYSRLEEDIELKIKNTKENILQLQERLKEEQMIREHRSKCEIVAGEVASYPSRSILKRKINQVESNVSNTRNFLAAIEADIQQKRNQFELMLQSISELQKCIRPEEEKTETENVEDPAIDDENNAEGDTREARKQEKKAKEDRSESVPDDADDDAIDPENSNLDAQIEADLEADPELEPEAEREPEPNPEPEPEPEPEPYRAMDIEAGEEVE